VLPLICPPMNARCRLTFHRIAKPRFRGGPEGLFGATCRIRRVAGPCFRPRVLGSRVLSGVHTTAHTHLALAIHWARPPGQRVQLHARDISHLAHELGLDPVPGTSQLTRQAHREFHVDVFSSSSTCSGTNRIPGRPGFGAGLVGAQER
jgi:hypothetical protein